MKMKDVLEHLGYLKKNGKFITDFFLVCVCVCVCVNNRIKSFYGPENIKLVAQFNKRKWLRKKKKSINE